MLALQSAHISHYETYQRQKWDVLCHTVLFVLIQKPIFLFIEGYIFHVFHDVTLPANEYALVY